MREKNQCQAMQDLLLFWFGRGQTASEVAREKSALWWSKNDDTDQQIIRRFVATHRAATAGELNHWGETPRGLLALIICTDQLPRNMYRHTPAAFADDSLALEFAKRGVQSGAVQQLQPIERVFAYLPFEHSEQLAEQQTSLALYQGLVEDADAETSDLFDNYCEFARKHHQIIQRFGRFPHRNQILARVSTAEEREFLQQPDSSF